MEIAFIPFFITKHISKDFNERYNYNIIISNIIIVVFFVLFKNHIINFLGYIPHFCLFEKIVSFPCPFCGTTRAICELSNGNFENAIQLNTTSILVALFIIFQILLRTYSLIQKRNINSISSVISKLLIITIVINGLKNIINI